MDDSSIPPTQDAHPGEPCYARHILEGIEGVIYVADPETYELLFANETFKRTWGPDVVGKKCYRVLQHRDAPCPFCTNDQIFGDLLGKTHVWEFQNEVTKAWFRCRDKAIRWSHGKMVRLEVATDITEEKRIEAALRIKDAFFDASMAAHSTADENGIIHLVNDAFVKLWGYASQEAAQGSSVGSFFVHPEDATPVLEALNTQKKWEGDFFAKRQNGERFISRGYATAIVDHQGHITGYQSTNIDVTELRENERRLTKLTEQLAGKTRELDLRSRIAEAFLTSTDEEIYSRVLKLTLEALGSPHGVFGHIDETGALVVPTMTRDIWDQCQVNDKDIVFPKDAWGDSIWPRALRQKQLLYSNERSVRTPTGHIPVDRNIAAPILYRDEAIGLLQVANKPSDYTEEDVRLMQAITSAIAPILYRRRAQEREQRRRRQAEADLRRERDFSNALLDALPGVFYLLDTEGRFLRWNENFCTVTGYSHAEFAQMSALALFAGAEKQRIAERIGHVFEDGAAVAEADIHTRDGRTIPYFFTGVRILMDGAPRLIGMGIDITPQRRAREELATIFEMSLNPICIADMNTATFTRVNPAFEAVLGYSPKELLSRPFLDFMHPDDVEPTLALLENKLKAGETVWHSENRYRAKDGSYRWLDWVSNPVPERGLMYATAFDVTERKRIDAELRVLTDDLARSNRELEQFAYVASHDLQEPLRMVSSYTQMLARRYGDQLDQDARDFIDYAVDGANRMQRLIQDLLSFSRVTTRGGELVPCDAHAALGDALKNLKATIDESGAFVSSDDLPMVLADPSQLSRLFQNLIANAIKFQRQGAVPRIHIAASHGDHRFTLSVADNGIGMEPQYFERIFTIFQRLHAKGDYPGTGIGLAICKRIVERHGGSIWVESEPEKGSTFHFTLASATEERRP